MTNSGLPPIGFKYVIDDSELNVVAARIQKQIDNLVKRGPEAAKAIEAALASFATAADISFNQKLGRYVDNSTKKIISQAEAIARTKVALGGLAQEIDKVGSKSQQPGLQLARGAESLDKAIGANTRSVRLFTSELVNVAGGGSQATSVITGLLTAVGPLSIALVVASGAIALVKSNLDSSRASFEAQQQAIANTTHSYDDLLRARGAALGDFGSAKTAVGLASQFESIFGTEFDLIGQKSGAAFSQALQLALHANITPQSIAQLLADAFKSASEFQDQLSILSRAKYDAAQKQAATGQFVQGALSRTNAINLQTEIDKLRASGATLDQLIPKYYELAKAKAASEAPTRGAADVGAGKVGRGAFGPVTGTDINALIGKQATDFSFLNPYADKFAQSFLDAQHQYQDASAASAEQHSDHLADIAAQGAEARAHIERSYARTLRDIEESLADGRSAAAESLADGLANAEQNAQERRVSIAENFAEQLARLEENAQERRAKIDAQYVDRRVDIEQSYQERVKQIGESYADAVFNAETRNDAHALIEARRAKEKALKDSDEQRKKELESAKKEHDKAQKELADSLAKQKAELQKEFAKQQKDLEEALRKQKAQLEKDYERRLRDLEKNAEKQKAKAAENYKDSLADQKAAQTKAEVSEAKSYADRKAAIEKSFVERKAQLIAGLIAEKDLSEKYAKDIIASLKGILNPAEIAALIKEFDAQLKAKIDITVTPFKTEGSGTKGGAPTPDGGRPRGFAFGGYDAYGGGRTDPGEWIIPNPMTAGLARWQQVVDGFIAHASRTVSPVMASRGSRSLGGTLDVRVNGRIAVTGDALSSQVEVMVGREIVSIVRDAIARQT